MDWVKLAGMVAETLAQVATIGLAAEDAVRGLRELEQEIDKHKAA